jgi:hypothetical protein
VILRSTDLSAGDLRSSLLPSSIQLLRCTAEAVRRPGAWLLVVPAFPLVGELPVGAHGSGDLGWILTRIDGSRAFLRTVVLAVLDPGSRDVPRDSLVVDASALRAEWWRRGDSNS